MKHGRMPNSNTLHLAPLPCRYLAMKLKIGIARSFRDSSVQFRMRLRVGLCMKSFVLLARNWGKDDTDAPAIAKFV